MRVASSASPRPTEPNISPWTTVAPGKSASRRFQEWNAGRTAGEEQRGDALGLDASIGERLFDRIRHPLHGAFDCLVEARARHRQAELLVGQRDLHLRLVAVGQVDLGPLYGSGQRVALAMGDDVDHALDQFGL